MSTIDPGGIEDTVREVAEDAEVYPSQRQAQRENEDLMGPSRWWFASTACPLLAATFGPIANGFSICALVYSWREYLPDGVQEASGQRLKDPSWLLALNAISLVCALTGNAALLLNMAKRLKFSIAQPITITGFLLAGVLLIADMAALTSDAEYFITDPPAQPANNHALTSAFYYAIFAASIYIIVGLLMCITVHGANRGYFAKDFYLTNAQRTLMLQTMSFIIYLLLGALVYSQLEGWRYLDAVYWADVTLLTVGLGDYAPETNVGRGLLFPFAIGGILMVGLVIGSIRTLVLERGKQKMAARITEKRRENAIYGVDQQRGTIKISWFAKADFNVAPTMSPAQRREEEFRVMRKVLAAAERERRYFALATSLSTTAILWLVGAVVFMVSENEQDWTYYQAVYFGFLGLLTIGYGDETPASNSGKAFFVIWSLLAVPTLTILISDLGDTLVKSFSEATNWTYTHLLPQDDVKQSARAAVCSAASKISNSEKKSQGNHISAEEHHQHTMRKLKERLEPHVTRGQLEEHRKAGQKDNDADRDFRFYLRVLARESKQALKDSRADDPPEYSWHDWEFYLQLMGNGNTDDTDNFPGQQISDELAPKALLHADAPFKAGGAFPALTNADAQGAHDEKSDLDGLVDRETQRDDKWSATPTKRGLLRKRRTVDPLGNWSWLDEQSPLMSSMSDSEWVSDKLAEALERESNRFYQGYTRRPPIGLRHLCEQHTG
ncbi:Putative Two pore domain potassium channel [Septoria linicola]|uniref:Two pore domain potassium channel n=1 Tax=Septoria linicola TaxID=215465 RepID=A0A9Q9AMH6_9PEZI|nr:putative Two pore domain potassium channel [Septoria linicola]USW50829.1 Putative Two pore domain potassium channel [Septoria linicola]